MNSRNNDLNWTWVKAFLFTAESGSLTAAAKELNTSQPTVGRQLTALEEQLNMALFERSGRGPELTPTGTQLLEYVRQMKEAADQFMMTVAGQAESIKGSIAITANEVTAAYLLPSIIEKLQNVEPEIEVELIAENSTTDLKRREADIALRGYRPTQEDLISKRVYTGSAGLYAATNYINRLGGLRCKEDLLNARFIAFDRGAEYQTALSSLGLDVGLDRFTVYVENHLVQWQLVKQGVGIGIMPNEVGEKEEDVQRLLAEELTLPYELWLTAHRELRTSQRIRRVYDFISEEIAAQMS